MPYPEECYSDPWWHRLVGKLNSLTKIRLDIPRIEVWEVPIVSAISNTLPNHTDSCVIKIHMILIDLIGKIFLWSFWIKLSCAKHCFYVFLWMYLSLSLDFMSKLLIFYIDMVSANAEGYWYPGLLQHQKTVTKPCKILPIIHECIDEWGNNTSWIKDKKFSSVIPFNKI